MNEAHNNNFPNEFDDEIDLKELFHALLQGKWIILFVTTFVSVIGVIYSLYLPNIYESKAVLTPVNQSSSISGALRGYSGLAGLAGISLPSGGNEGNSDKALQKIGSLSFFENSLLSNIYLPNLMAVKSWDYKTNTLDYDKNIFNINSNVWIRDYSYPRQQTPTAQESFEVFKTKHLNLVSDKKSGFITLSIKHQSPFVAKQWVELVVSEINAYYSQKDKAESEKAVSYLSQQILKTNLSEIKLVMAELLQEETKKLTLIEANKFYVFEYIDPPVVMEMKSEPIRSIICIISALFGGMLGLFIVLIKNYFYRKSQPSY